MGEFAANDWHGNGIYTWADGRKYTEKFVHNKMQGMSFCPGLTAVSTIENSLTTRGKALAL